MWLTCGDDNYGRIVKLLALTGCRFSEIADLQWHEVNVELQQLELPGGRTKNKRDHVVQLSPLAWLLLPERPAEPERKPYVFGRYAATKGFSGEGKCKKQLDQRIAAVRGGKPLPR